MQNEGHKGHKNNADGHENTKQNVKVSNILKETITWSPNGLKKAHMNKGGGGG
jgi:hypothetical protein